MAVTGINLSNVNISLAEFQKMSNGKYNAGEVKLASETGLQKVNNHIHRLGANDEEISHEEVLAIKRAFVKALSTSGVSNKEELNKIRVELGLAPEKKVDLTLRNRSIKPLTRQQIRDIIDRNVSFLGNAVHNGTIRTSDQLYGGLSDQERARRAGKREEAAVARLGNIDYDENENLLLLQELIGGTADFHGEEDRDKLLSIAREQARAVMNECNGNPSDEEPCVLSYSTSAGVTFKIPTGLTQKKFLEMIDDACMRLGHTASPEDKTLEARRLFVELPVDKRLPYLRNLASKAKASEANASEANASKANASEANAGKADAGDADARFKMRTALVALLQERGINDYETLSIVNRLVPGNLKIMAETLLLTMKDFSGDDLRGSRYMTALASEADGNKEVPANERAFIPALSIIVYNEKLASDVSLDSGKLPPSIKRIMEQLRTDMHARFGESVPENRDLAFLTGDISGAVRVLAKEGKLATAKNIREALENAALDKSISNYLVDVAKDFGVEEKKRLTFATLIKNVSPELVDRLRKVQNPPEAANAIQDYRAKLERTAKLMDICEANRKNVNRIYRQTFADELGVDVKSEVVKRAETHHVADAAGKLTIEICRGSRQLDTADAIGTAFENLAKEQARQRVKLIKDVDKTGLSSFAAKAMKRHIVSLARTDRLDFGKFKDYAAADDLKSHAKKVERLIDENASVKQICKGLGDMFAACKNKIRDLLHKEGEVGDVGADDFATYGIPLQIHVLDSQRGLVDKVKNFYERDDVETLNFNNENSFAAQAKSLFDAFGKVSDFEV